MDAGHVSSGENKSFQAPTQSAGVQWVLGRKLVQLLINAAITASDGAAMSLALLRAIANSMHSVHTRRTLTIALHSPRAHARLASFKIIVPFALQR